MTALVDEFEIIRRWKKTSTFLICCLLFIAGLPCTTQVYCNEKYVLAFTVSPCNLVFSVTEQNTARSTFLISDMVGFSFPVVKYKFCK